MVRERLLGKREAPWWKENVAGRAHDTFISQAGAPGEWLARIQDAAAEATKESARADWGAAVAAARILLETGTAEAWVLSAEGRAALKQQLEQSGMSPAEGMCPVAWAAGGKGVGEGHSLWGLFCAAKRTLWLAPEARKRTRL